MTSRLPRAQSFDAMETPVAQPVPVSGRIDASNCDMDVERNLQLKRRRDDSYEEGPSRATAALFIGLLMGAVSTALMIWVAVFVLSM